MLTFFINDDSTRGRGGQEPPRCMRALVKETGNPTWIFGSRPLRTRSSPGDHTDSWRGPCAAQRIICIVYWNSYAAA